MADPKTATVKDIDAVDPTFFVDASTQENYKQIARDAAKQSGKSPKACLAEMAKEFERQHEVEPTGGYDHLAAWAKKTDPDEGQGPKPAELAKARAVESARRDPSTALAGDPDVVAAAKEAAIAEPTTVDGGIEGFGPNTGPVTTTGS